jgi:hypothetical protein
MMSVLFVALSLLAVACSGTSSGGSDTVGTDVPPDDGNAGEGVEVGPDVACEAPTTVCGGTCCAEGWKCKNDQCVQCATDATCAGFAECSGGRCRCDAGLCVEKPCDLASCKDSQHCEWTENGMACVENVCDPACETGTHCVDDECVPYCDAECDDGTHCEWVAGAMDCVWDPCDPTCASDQHCEKGGCVDNECTGDYTQTECEALSCVCLADGSCGDCTDCVPACGAGFTCSVVDGTPTCVEIICTEPACTPGQHCLPGNVCEDNVCTPPCEGSGWCAVDGGTDADCEYQCTPACAFDQICDKGACVDAPCDKACDPGSHCEWGTDDKVCVETVCEPACGLGQACTWDPAAEAASCSTQVCDPECTWYQYCDDKNTCQPFQCTPACEKNEHCGGTNLCVPNDCPGECVSPKYFDQDCTCVDICEGCGTDGPKVCALVDDAGSGAFVSFDNMCKATCHPGFQEVAVCGEYAFDPVCDVTGYLDDPAADNTYDNVCDAQCNGKGDLVHGECSCAVTCTDDELASGPMCGMDCLDYQNLCDVRCGNTTARYPGTCQKGCGLCSPCDQEDFFDPVCGSNSVTYQSMCDLTVCHPGEGYVHPGSCVNPNCLCPSTQAPVCGSIPGSDDWRTFVNVCDANCYDAEVWFDYVCTACDPRPEAPVCAHNAFLENWMSEPNQCVADSYGSFDAVYPGACVCCPAANGQPSGLDGCCDLSQKAPVCGVDGVTYANACALTCAGVAKKGDGECQCPDTWDPVCGDSVADPGKKYTYANACIAKAKYGVTSFTSGQCALCSAACAEAPGDPVCGLDGASYPDVCYLVKCNGDALTLGLNDSACNGSCPCQ